MDEGGSGAVLVETARLWKMPPPLLLPEEELLPPCPVAAACIDIAVGAPMDGICAALLRVLKSIALGRSGGEEIRRWIFSSDCVCGSLSFRKESRIDSSISSRTFCTLGRNTFASGGISVSGIFANMSRTLAGRLTSFGALRVMYSLMSRRQIPLSCAIRGSNAESSLSSGNCSLHSV